MIVKVFLKAFVYAFDKFLIVVFQTHCTALLQLLCVPIVVCHTRYFEGIHE